MSTIATKRAPLATALVVYGGLLLVGIGLGAGTAAATPAAQVGATNSGAQSPGETDLDQRLQRSLDSERQMQQTLTNHIKKSSDTQNDVAAHLKP
jgi:uncharacterized protein YlxW (UPF0749 family)